MCMRSFRWGNTRSGTASQPGLNSAGRQQPCQHPALRLAPCALLCPANQLAALHQGPRHQSDAILFPSTANHELCAGRECRDDG